MDAHGLGCGSLRTSYPCPLALPYLLYVSLSCPLLKAHRIIAARLVFDSLHPTRTMYIVSFAEPETWPSQLLLFFCQTQLLKTTVVFHMRNSQV